MTDLKAGLEALPDDEEFAEYDLWQSDYEGESELCVGKIDARDLTHFKDTLKLVGAYDPNFKLRYPVTMIIREGAGKLASFGTMPNADGLGLAFREKLLTISKAEEKDAPE